MNRPTKKQAFWLILALAFMVESRVGACQAYRHNEDLKRRFHSMEGR